MVTVPHEMVGLERLPEYRCPTVSCMFVRTYNICTCGKHSDHLPICTPCRQLKILHGNSQASTYFESNAYIHMHIRTYLQPRSNCPKDKFDLQEVENSHFQQHLRRGEWRKRYLSLHTNESHKYSQTSL